MNYKIFEHITDKIASFLKEKYESSFLTEVYLKNRYLNRGVDLFYFCTFDDKGQQLSDVLVYYIDHKKVVVVNWLIDIKPELSNLFETVIFESNDNVNCVHYRLTANKIKSNHSFSFVDNADMCILLPSTREEYNKMLSTNSRKAYVKKTHRVERDMECMVVDETASQDNIHMVDSLAQWKQKQMAQQGVKSTVIVDFVKSVLLELGSISYIKDKEGDVVCVCIFYKVGKHIYYEQTAYDDKYAYYSLGRVLVYQSILHFIDEGFTHFHFLWKGADYKKHYSAIEIPLFSTFSYKKQGFSYLLNYSKYKTRIYIRRALRTSVGSTIRKRLRKLFS